MRWPRLLGIFLLQKNIEIIGVNGQGTSVPPLVDFQVAQPPIVPHNAKQCTINILHREFGNSFGHPEVIQYTPPQNCGTPGSWAAITLNWTATSNGTQFDRLSAISFQNVEIWRTSTPEPIATGIIWTYIKDVSRYVPLFAKPGTLILDLNNIVDPTQNLTGLYDVRLSATFYASSKQTPPARKSSVIIPITNMSPDMANYVSVPPTFSLNISFPINSIEAYAEIYASGNAQEEFWFGNAPDLVFSEVDAISPQFTFPRGPFREVRLLVDGILAGVALPYPVFFTGADIPPAWRPIVSYGALDLPTYYVDLTPFVPLLANGQSHNISIDVISAEANHTIDQNWFLSGNIQVFTDPSGKQTKGSITKYAVSPFPSSSTHLSRGKNTDLNITVQASRQLTIEADVISGSGKKTHIVWKQDHSYSNLQVYLNNITRQIVNQVSRGTTLSTHNGVLVVQDIFTYPALIDFAELPFNPIIQSGWTTFFDHSYNRILIPNPLLVGSTIQTHQITNGSRIVFTNGTKIGDGTNNNTFIYSDLVGNTYTRNVNVANDIILFDKEGGNLKPVGDHTTLPSQISNVNAPFAARLPGGKKIVNGPPHG